jgi:glycosyltransferase involved in cell wall biosynthesis
MMTILANSDVFVMPSLRESCGNSVLEAMAMGLPVVVADWGGPGLIVDASCGMKVAPDSPAALVAGLAEAMATLVADPELRQRLGQAGRSRIRSQHFDWDTKIDYLMGVFERVAYARLPEPDRLRSGALLCGDG